KEFEKEADYLGTYIAAVSGYDITNAANLWRKMAAEYPGSTKDIFLATHPSSPERYILIEKTVKEIKEKQEKGLPLKVEFKK
ncbi:MAG: M48 family metalloprotease, partial [Candidatus Omnitrophica bacterium]|nr:M48 family metalloprotease [Candidatus Omnitrophota bacterium]